MGLIDFYNNCKYAIEDCIDWFSSDNSSNTSQSNSSIDKSAKISASKGVRTKKRKAAIMELIHNQTFQTYKKIESAIENDKRDLGEIQLTLKSDNACHIQFSATKDAIILLGTAFNERNESNLPMGENFYLERETTASDLILDLVPVDIYKVLKKADQDFGPMAGMNVDDKYVEDDDPFIQRLRRM